MEKGFMDTGLRISHYISSCQNWTVEELENRKKILNNEALTLWPYPQTSFTFELKESLEYSLADDFVFRGYKIKSYIYFLKLNIIQKHGLRCL